MPKGENVNDPADDAPHPTVWVTVAEAAEKSGIGSSTIRQWYRSGRIPTQRAGGDKGAFLVPLDAVIALADRADEEGDDLGAAVIDLNASYWSAQTEAAREEAAEVRKELAHVRQQLDELRRQQAAPAAATATATAAPVDDRSEELAAAQDEVRQLQEDLTGAEADLDIIEAELAAARKERDDALAEVRRLTAEGTAAAGAALDAVVAERDRLSAENADLREELDGLRAELGTAKEELADVGQELRSSTEELDRFRHRISLLQEELTELRAVTAKAGSITDNSWLEQPTNAYQSPVRPQGMAAAEALSDLLASTQPDLGVPTSLLDDAAGTPAPTPAKGAAGTKRSKPARTVFDDVDQRKAAVNRPRVADPDPFDESGPEAGETPADHDEARVDDETWAEERRAAARDFGFGQHDDDLLPKPEKKPRRGRK